MKIRKRFLSLSAAIAATQSSDLHQHQQLVQHQEEVHPNVVVYDNTRSEFPNHCYQHPMPPQIGLQPSTWISSGAGSHDPNNKELESLSWKKEIEIVTTDDDTAGCRKESITDEANPHDLVLKEEGDSCCRQLIPIKKRRGSCCFQKTSMKCHDTNNIKEEEEEDHINNEMMMIEGTFMKSSKPKKNDYNYEAAAAIASSPIINKKKKKKKGGGSRCSRVNGRGWRCSQQTLVGYSLCDHHLGKGRLIRRRSIQLMTTTSVRRPHNNNINALLIQKPQQTTTTTKETQDHKQASTKIEEDHEFQEDTDGEELEFKDWDDDQVESSMSSSSTQIPSKSRTKQLVKKARSLSSLLSQIN